jgi:glycosyltransferase 2 family protein
MLAAMLGRRAANGTGSMRLMPRQKVWALAALKVGLSALAVGIVVSTVDLSSAWQRASSQNVWLVLVAAGVMLLQTALGGLRWHVILRRLGVPARVGETLRLYYISAFFNACLWGTVGGDIIRAWLSSRRQERAGIAILSVLLDRVAALAAVAVLVFVTAPFFVARVGRPLAALIPAGLAVAGLVGIGIAAQLDRLPLHWQRFRPVRILHAIGSAMRSIFLRPSSALSALGLAIAAQTAMSLCAYVIAASLEINLTLLDCLVLMQPVALITALPISVGGWGVREAAMIGLLGLAGVPSSAALALSVQLGLLATVVSLPGGVVWLMLRSGPSEELEMAHPRSTAS